jgi:hypothetical protein
MSERKKKKPPRDGYVLVPSVTHPQGREKLFTDAMKAMVRAMIEANDNPMWAYAIDKSDRIVTTEDRHLLSPEEQAEWDAACTEFEGMSAVVIEDETIPKGTDFRLFTDRQQVDETLPEPSTSFGMEVAG